MIDPPLRTSPTKPPSGETTIYVVGGEDLLEVQAALRAHGYVVRSLDASAFAEQVRQAAPAAAIVDVREPTARSAVLDVGELVAGTATDIFLIDEVSDEEKRDQGNDVLHSIAAEVFAWPIDVDYLLDRVAGLARHRRGVTAAPPPPPSSPSSSSSFSSSSLGSDQPRTIGLFDAEEAEFLLAGDGLPPAPLMSYPPGAQTSTPPGSSSAPPGWPSAVPQPLGMGALNNGAFAGPTSVSAELEKLLAEAEKRVLSEEHAVFEVPSPEAEVNAILPPEVLAALDDPLESSDDDDFAGGSESQTPVGRGTSGGTSGSTAQRSRVAGTDSGESVVPAEPVTAHGPPDQPATGSATSGTSATASAAMSAITSATPVADAVPNSLRGARRSGTSATVPNPYGSSGGGLPWLRQDARGTEPNGDATPIPSDEGHPPRLQYAPRMEADATPIPGQRWSDRRSSADSSPMSAVPRTTAAGSQQFFAPPSVQVPTPQAQQPPQISAPEAGPGLPEVLTPEYDGLRALGACIAGRVSATLCFEYNGALCRAVLRDGDFVTCGSSADDESLLAFLMLRGDMPREVGMQMVGRIPPFGRHAAAALIANGFVGQDQLWVVLRAHAEWLLGRMASTQGGTCALEVEPQGRLRAEPAVFGGATGAEVFVEVCQRVMPHEDAIDRLGGPATRLGPGVNEALVTECALNERERSAVERSPGRTVDEVIEAVGQPEFAAVLVALHELGVLDLMPSIGAAPHRHDPAAPDPLDQEAIRKRIHARIAIIQEGDYFEVIGVPRSATGYEIRRAYLESRRAFEPAHLLTAQTADLVDDVRLIVDVLDEAYELLRDEPRRERYRRALEAIPPPDR